MTWLETNGLPKRNNTGRMLQKFRRVLNLLALLKSKILIENKLSQNLAWSHKIF